MTGASVSSINGLLSATGSVYLINPNGVIVGKSGIVNVGGTFVASTLDVADASFLAGGALDFTGASNASVINLGRIGALGGDVALMGAKVENDGTISAAGGTAALVAGHSVLLRDAALDDGRFAVLVGGADTSVTNTGLIQAANAELRAEGGNVYALAGNTAGVVRATGVKDGDGKVWLVAEGGTLDVAGAIEAQGANGAGGSIETSGATVSLGQAKIDAHGGSWLVDPVDLTIDATAATTIDNALNAGTSVTEQTTASGSSGAGTPNASGAGDIIVAAPISWATTAGLTLSAYRDIDVNASITASGGGALTLVTDNSGAGNGGTLAFAPGASVQFTGVANGQPTGSLAIGVGTAAPTAYVLVSDLTTLSNDIAANNAGAYALATSVDGSNAGAGYTTASPLASTLDAGFAGTLEGLGNSVTNLTINDPADAGVGLFAQIAAAGVVRDLNLAGGSVMGNSTVGALAGENDGSVISVTSSAAVAGGATAAEYGTSVGGLVGYNTGTINQSSASGAVIGYQAVGGLVGIDNGDSTAAPGVIENSYATGQVTVGSGLGGGLVGNAYGASAAGAQFINDHATGSVTDTGVYNVDYPGEDGGLLGNILAGSVTGSYATGAVTSAQGYAVGGLIGYVGRTGNVTISDSYATGSVSTFNDAGGLIGYVRPPENNANVQRLGVLTITDSYATGSVIAASFDAGGLIGGLYQVGAASGPAVSNSNTAISDVYATGYVYSPKAAGGLIGMNPGTALMITNGYFDTSTTGQTADSANTAGGMGMTTAQLQAALPAGFDSATWGIVADASYPYLLSQFVAGATPEVISGIAGGGGSYASSANGAALVGVARNGVSLGEVSTGANGYYYVLAAPSGNAAPANGAVQDTILAYLAGSAQTGAAYTETNINNPLAASRNTTDSSQSAGLNIYANALSINTVQATLSGVAGSLAADAAAAPASAIAFTASAAGGIATTGGTYIAIGSAGDLALDGNVNAGTANLSFNINGDLTQTAGVLTGNTLSGVSQGGVSLPNGNLVNNLGYFSASTGLVFNNAQALTVTGTVAGGSGNTSISTASGDLTVASTGSVSGDLTMSAGADLDIMGSITASDVLNLYADAAGTTNAQGQGVGAVNFAPNSTVTAGSNGAVNIYTNTLNADGSAAQTPAEYSAYVTGGSTLTTFSYVYTLAQLQGIDATSTSLAGDYALNANIDASATGGANPTVTFTPIGERSPFSGVFDGLNHTITNLTINDANDENVGLFAQNSGMIRNIGLMNLTVGSQKARARVGGLVGYNDGGSISNSFVTGTVSGSNSGDVGGLVGYNDGDGGTASIANSYATGIVTTGQYGTAGGLVGHNDGDNGTASIANSYATGAVTTGQSGTAGGLVGYNDGDGGTASIANSYATGAVSDGGAVESTLGGLIGANQADGGTASVSQSFATGPVTGGMNATAGGLIGYNDGYSDGNGGSTVTDAFATGAVSVGAGGYAGGLIGYNDGDDGSISIADTYATGAVIGTGATLGGLVGYNDGDGGSISITHSYFDTQTTGQTKGSGGTNGSDQIDDGSKGLTTAQLQGTAFQEEYGFDANFGYGTNLFPYLTVFYTDPTTNVVTAPTAINGTAYSDAGVTLLASNAANGVQFVTALGNGASLGQVSTGADGSFYIVQAPGAPALTGLTVAYTTADNTAGGAVTGAHLDSLAGTVAGFDIWGGTLIAPTAAASLSAAPTTTAALLAANGGADQALLTAAAGTNTAVAAGAAALANVGYIATTPSFTIDQSPAVSLYVGSDSGDIVVDAAAPVVVADGTTLELSAPNGSLTFDTSMDVGTVGGTGGALRLYASTDPTYGTLNLSFAPGASLSYPATAAAGEGDSVGAPLGSLSINGAAYTLINELAQTGQTMADSGTHDVAAIDAIDSRTGSDGDFALVADLSGAGTTFKSALAGAEGFTGVFEGLGHTISNLTINPTSDVGSLGLFGSISKNGTVRDIGLVNAAVSSEADSASEVGALAGYNDGTIINAYATGSVTPYSAEPGYAGGLVGENLGTILKSYATASVAAASGKAPFTVEGLEFPAGYLSVGGLAGYNGGTIDTSFATGQVQGGSYTYVGGLVGQNAGTGKITNAYATGAVTGAVGTLGVGSDVGGLVGDNAGAISSAYATGYVSTPTASTMTATGGLVGMQETGATLTTSGYFDTSTTGQTTDPSGATGETTAQLQSALPAGFGAAWATGAGLYPYLASFFPGGVQALTTTATGTGVAGGEVAFYAGGGLVGQGPASVGADGYAYQAVAAGTVATGAPVGATLALPGATTPTAVSFTDAPTAVPGTTGAIAAAPITAGVVSATTVQPLYSGLLAELNATFGPVYRAYVAAPPTGEALSITGTNTSGFSVDQPLGWTATGPLTLATTAGNLGLNAPVSAAGTLDLVSAGAIFEFLADGVTTTTLTGSAATKATLSGPNSVATLAGFTAPGGFTLADAVDLTVAGPVTGGAVTLSSTGSIAVDGAVSSTNGGAVLVYADSAASGAGTVTFGTGASVTTTGPVTILYNPYDATTGYLGADSSTRAGNPFSADIHDASSVSVRMLVDDATELQALNTELNGLYQLNADLNLQNMTFTPLGTGAGLGSTAATAAGFTGLLDGSRPLGGTAHTVSNLTLDTALAGAGMFDVIGATGVVQNLNLSDVSITSTASGTGYGYVGGLVGDLYGAVTNVGVTGKVAGVSAVGGLAGLAEGGSTITNATAAVTTGGTDYVGGLVGLNYGAVNGAMASGMVTGAEYVGGLAGWNETSANGGGLGTISNASAEGTVTASGDYAGGLVGVNDGSIIASATGGSMVSGASYVGGLVGYSGSGSSVISGSVAKQTAVTASGNYVGGLVGMNEGEVTGSSASGSVMGVEYVGGLVGWNDPSLGGATAGTIANTSSSAQVTGSSDYVGGLVGVNTGTITGSQAGPATVSGANLVGGLVGYNAGSIATSSSAAPVSGQVYLGGLVGWNAGTVATSYATGAVTGMAGDQDATNDSFAGGLVGVNFGSVSNTYATGAVTGANVVGGLVGDNAAGANADTSYATGAVAGSGALVGGVIGYNAGEVSYVYGFPALSGQQMATGYQDTTASGTGATSLTADQEDGSTGYAGFDFDATWTANPDAPPTLQQNPPTP